MKRVQKAAWIGATLALTAVVALPVLQNGAFAATAKNTAATKHTVHVKRAPAIVENAIHSKSFAAFLHLKPQVVHADLQHHKTLLELALTAKITRPRLLSEIETLIRDQVNVEIKDKHLTAAKASALEKTINTSLPVWVADSHLSRRRGPALSGGLLTETAKLTHLSAKEVKTKLHSGESIVKMAAAVHLSEPVLTKDLVAYKSAHDKHKVSAQILQKEVVRLINER